MAQRSLTQAPGHRLWPMTREVCDRLEGEIAELRAELTALSGQGLEEGIVRLPFMIAARRLHALRQVLDSADVVDGERCHIGHSVTWLPKRE